MCCGVLPQDAEIFRLFKAMWPHGVEIAMW